MTIANTTHPRAMGDCLPAPAYLEIASPIILARAIRQLCDGRGVAYSRFGRDAVNDPRLISDLREGRVLNTQTRLKVLDHLAALRSMEARQG